MNKSKIERAILCMSIAKKYKSLEEFGLSEPDVYNMAKTNYWLSQCEAVIKHRGLIDIQQILKRASVHGSIEKWKKTAPASYEKAKQLGLIAFCIDYIGLYHSKLPVQVVKEYVSSFKTRTALVKNATVIYLRCIHDQKLAIWLNQQFGDARKVEVADCDYDICLKHAQETANLEEFKQKKPSYYHKARIEAWLQDIREQCGWATSFNAEKRDQLIKSAKPFKHKSDWFRACYKDYLTASNLGLISQCCAHMEAKHSERSKPTTWTKEKCHEIAKNYSTRTDWFRADANSYQAARKNGWLNFCTSHMVLLRKPSRRSKILTEAF